VIVGWVREVADQPVEALAVAAGLVAAATLGGFALRPLTRRTRSLHHLVLVIALASLLVGALVAVVLARLMVLDGDEARMVLVVLGVTAVFAAVLVVIASGPLAHDAAALEAAVRRLEGGDRTGRTGVRRSDELGHVARALDELTERLDALEGARAAVEAERRLMFTSIGHDLRTPLAAIRAATEALLDGIAPEPTRYLQAIERDVAALTALVDDVFLLARIESGTFAPGGERIDLVELVDDAVEALQPAASARSVAIALRARRSVQVAGSPTALGRLVRNLLDNAIRHTPDGSTVTIEVIADGLADGVGDGVGSGARAIVRVVDEGDGFDADFVDRAFDRFSRPDPSRARAGGGAGLGLAIARGIVEAHGGAIRIEAAAGGSVVVDLPAAR